MLQKYFAVYCKRTGIECHKTNKHVHCLRQLFLILSSSNPAGKDDRWVPFGACHVQELSACCPEPGNTWSVCCRCTSVAEDHQHCSLAGLSSLTGMGFCALKVGKSTISRYNLQNL